jgi:hypothetical protein
MNEIAARLAARLFDCRIIANQFRSAFIEAMIEPFLAQTGWRYVGGSWSGWDFERGGIERLEVKQSAAHQTWSDDRRVETRGSFDLAPCTGYWFENGSKWMASPGRDAQVYVFAWNDTYGPTADHRNPDQRNSFHRISGRFRFQNQKDSCPGEDCRFGSHSGSGAFANEWDKL